MWEHLGLSYSPAEGRVKPLPASPFPAIVSWAALVRKYPGTRALALSHLRSFLARREALLC